MFTKKKLLFKFRLISWYVTNILLVKKKQKKLLIDKKHETLQLISGCQENNFF